MKIIPNDEVLKLSEYVAPLAKIASDWFDEKIRGNDFETKSISVFDHWLSEEECDEQIIFHNKTRGARNIENKKKYYDYQNRFVGFYKELYLKHELIYTSFYEEYPQIFREFDSIKELIVETRNIVRSERGSIFINPNMPLMIVTGFDYTHHITFPTKHKSTVLESLEKMLKNNNLFILEW